MNGMSIEEMREAIKKHDAEKLHPYGLDVVSRNAYGARGTLFIRGSCGESKERFAALLPEESAAIDVILEAVLKRGGK